MRDFKQEEQDYNRIIEMLQGTSRENPRVLENGIALSTSSPVPNMIKKIWLDKNRETVLMILDYDYEGFENEPDYGIEKDLDELSGPSLRIIVKELSK